MSSLTVEISSSHAKSTVHNDTSCNWDLVESCKVDSPHRQISARDKLGIASWNLGSFLLWWVPRRCWTSWFTPTCTKWSSSRALNARGRTSGGLCPRCSADRRSSIWRTSISEYHGFAPNTYCNYSYWPCIYFEINVSVKNIRSRQQYAFQIFQWIMLQWISETIFTSE